MFKFVDNTMIYIYIYIYLQFQFLDTHLGCIISVSGPMFLFCMQSLSYFLYITFTILKRPLAKTKCTKKLLYDKISNHYNHFQEFRLNFRRAIHCKIIFKFLKRKTLVWAVHFDRSCAQESDTIDKTLV